MDNLDISQWSSQINSSLLISSALAAVVGFIPRLLIALFLFVLGRILANSAARTMARILKAIHLTQLVESFQLGISLPTKTEHGIIRVFSMIVRYIVLYGTLIVVLQVVGLSSVASFFIRITEIFPKLLSSLLILIIGIISAGFVETLVKRAVLVLDPATARLSGKVSSYIVISFFLLMALSELGLAATFVNTLFIGMVATVALSVGLAVGLGAKDLVKEVLLRWYERRK